MTAFTVASASLEEEQGFFNADGTAQSFFFFRYFDVISDTFLDELGVGPVARAEKDLSTYIATADVTIHAPVKRGDALRFEFDVARIGGKSFGYQGRMLALGSGTLHATYDAVSVTMDMSDAPTPIAIPDDTRAVLNRYAGDAA